MKKVICAIAALMILGSSAYAARFEDTKGHWAENTINRLADRGIVDGVSQNYFNPNGFITRAEYLKMMMNFSNIPTQPYRVGDCLDAKSTDWYADHLQSALDKGIIPREMIASYKAIIGDTGGVKYTGAFNGDLAIEREEMAALTMHLYQYALTASDVNNMKPATGVSFGDTSSISVWALPSVKLAVAQGFIEGMEDGRFQPRENATRAQAATIIGRILDRQE